MQKNPPPLPSFFCHVSLPEGEDLFRTIFFTKNQPGSMLLLLEPWRRRGERKIRVIAITNYGAVPNHPNQNFAIAFISSLFCDFMQRDP